MITATRADVHDRPYISVGSVDTFDGDVDLIAVERAVNGVPTSLSPAEKIYAAKLLRGRGLVVRDIGERLGVSHPTVLVWQANGWKVER